MRRECVIVADAPDVLTNLCGISVLERLLRTLQRCGIEHAIILTAEPNEISNHLAAPSWARSRLQLTVHQRNPGEVAIEQVAGLWPAAAEFLLVLRGDTVFDPRLLDLLSKQNHAATLMDGENLCGAALIDQNWASKQNGVLEDAIRLGCEKGEIVALNIRELPSYSPSLRRNLKPFWLSTISPEKKQIAEAVLIDATQKGAQDLPALVHAPIEKFLVARLCKTKITPHQLSITWIILAFLVTFLFVSGHLVSGIVLAFVIGILDGLDGKQARLKVETSKSGKIEHHFDSFFEVAWPTALAYHFYASGELPTAFVYLLILVAAEAVDGIAKGGIYLAFEKMMRPPDPLDRVVRLFGGRRNVYIWILTVAVILGIPAQGLVVMAWWESVTALVDLPHAAWLLYRARSR